MEQILILGATSDMAMAVAEKFASEGFTIGLAGRRVKRLDEFKSHLQIKYNVEVTLFEWDAIQAESYNSIEDFCRNSKVVVCALGYLGDQEGALKSPEESWGIMNSNYNGPVIALNFVLQNWNERTSGTIIGISSVAGNRGRQSNFIYGSAKAGFSTYLSGLRNLLHPRGIKVLTVKPGFVDTKMVQHLDLPKTLTASAEMVAKKIFKGYARKKDVIYVLPIWRWIMLIIVLIPESIFKKLKL